MTWSPLTESADRIWLAQRWSPGLCDISGANSPREWEQIKSHGYSGAAIEFRGVGLARFSVKLRLYTEEDWQDWARFKPLVDKPPVQDKQHSKKQAKPLALDIWHPFLADNGIFSVVVEDVSQPEQTADGEWTIEIKFLEYRAPTKALARPKGAAATATPSPKEQMLSRLLDIVTTRLLAGKPPPPAAPPV